MKEILVLTDNELLLRKFHELVMFLNIESKYQFDFAYSPKNKFFINKYSNDTNFLPIDVKQDVNKIINKYDLVFSLHSKQFFPEELVKKVKCINVHPGLNPYNRGWYPQVFSIINQLPAGVTIHEMDEQLDHGPIIFQKHVQIELWDTSLSVYNKIITAEIDLLEHNLISIIEGDYKVIMPDEGNINLKKDFDALCKIDLNDKNTFLNHINQLRALTHGDYSNAYFIDNNGNKIFISINLVKK